MSRLYIILLGLLMVSPAKADLDLALFSNVNTIGGNTSVVEFTVECSVLAALRLSYYQDSVGYDFGYLDDSQSTAVWRTFDSGEYSCGDNPIAKFTYSTADIASISTNLVKFRVWDPNAGDSTAVWNTVVELDIPVDLDPPTVSLSSVKDSVTAASFSNGATVSVIPTTGDIVVLVASASTDIERVMLTLGDYANDKSAAQQVSGGGWEFVVPKNDLPYGWQTLSVVAEDVNQNVGEPVTRSLNFVNEYLPLRIIDFNSEVSCKAYAIKVASGDYFFQDTLCVDQITGSEVRTWNNSSVMELNFSDGVSSRYCDFRVIYRDSSETKVFAAGDCVGGVASISEDSDGDGIPDRFDLDPFTPYLAQARPSVGARAEDWVAYFCGESSADGDVNIAYVTYQNGDSVSCTSSGYIATGANVTVNSGAQVEYLGDSVYLNPGFKAAPGSGFRARTGTILRTAVRDVGGASKDAVISSSLGANTGKTDPIALEPQVLDWSSLPSTLRERLEAFSARVADLFGSADGRVIVFTTDAALSQNDSNGVEDVYLYWVEQDQLTLVSRGLSGDAANAGSAQARIDGAGNYVVFASEATDIVLEDDNELSDVFIYSINGGALEKVSSGFDGEGVPVKATHPSIATEFPLVVFDQGASNEDALLRVVQAYDYRWPSLESVLVSGGAPESFDSHHPGITADGRYMVYIEQARGRPVDDCRMVFRDLELDQVARESCPEVDMADVEVELFPVFTNNGRKVQWLMLTPVWGGNIPSPKPAIVVENPFLN